MIVKPFLPPIRVIKLETLVRRLPLTHPDRQSIDFEYKSRLKGFKGEKSLLFYLNVLPKEKYYIFHDLRLYDGEDFFQIDVLLLCKAYALILESKKTGDEITFERNLNQTTRMKNGKKVRMKNPVLQAKFQAIKLKNWLSDHHCPSLPIFYLFVNTKEDTLILTDHWNEQINGSVCNSEGLLEKISHIDNDCVSDSINQKDMNKIKHLLLDNHFPDDPDILKEYHLSPNDIPTGVICPSCQYTPMKYINGKWFCPHCRRKSKDAHVLAVYDFFLLIKPAISNAGARTFLHLSSRKAAYNLLRSMQLPFSGERKTRIYFLPKNFPHPDA